MEPNKFENHIKKQLEEREILPSSDAWLKLSDRLDETVIEQPKRRGYFWYAVAACLVGLIILSTVFFNPATTPESNIQVVQDEEEATEESYSFKNDEIPKKAVQVVSMESIPEEKVNNTKVVVNEKAAEKQEFAEELAAVPNEVQVPLNDNSESIINSKVLQVLAQVDVLEQDREALTDAEVDSLLRKAQEEILTDKLFRSDHSVDAMALLSEVENELDKSFRDQIFESLKSGFLKVRTAVADRNN